MLYVWQLNCLVMFILTFGPLMLTLVQMKGHVLHFSWLHGVVPGVLVTGCRSFDRTNMSRILVSRLWWSAKDLGHLSACLQETPIRQDDFAHADSRGVVKETHDRSLVGGRFAVGLQCFFFVGEWV